MAELKLHQPFIITARLAPGLRIGDAFLSLVNASWTDKGQTALGKRQTATMALDLPGGTSYEDDSMQSGCGGFGGVVTIFETYLTFLLAAVESYEYEQRNPGREGESTSLFPRHIVEWASENKFEIEGVHCWIQTEHGECNETLIEVTA